jgi:hypothetical protein
VENATYNEFLRQSGAKNVADLKAAKESDLAFANNNMTFNSPYGLFTFGPAVDDYYVPAPVSLILKAGLSWRDFDLFVAHNGNEGLLFTPPWIQDDDGFRAHVLQAFPAIKKDDLDNVIKDLYPRNSSGTIKDQIQRLATALADVAVTCNTNYLLSNSGQYYSFKYVFDIPASFHGQDTYYTVSSVFLANIAPAYD